MTLIAEFKIYILGTVRMSLLHMVMMRRITLPVVPNIKGTAYIGTASKTYKHKCLCALNRTFAPLCRCARSLYICCPRNAVYYTLSTTISLTPPTHSLHLARCVIFRHQSMILCPNVTNLTPSPQFLQLTVIL
jgi:hypothetical protein